MILYRVCRGPPESRSVVLKPINLLVADKIKFSVPETSSYSALLLTPISAVEASCNVNFKYLIPTESVLNVIEVKSEELVSKD